MNFVCYAITWRKGLFFWSRKYLSSSKALHHSMSCISRCYKNHFILHRVSEFPPDTRLLHRFWKTRYFFTNCNKVTTWHNRRNFGNLNSTLWVNKLLIIDIPTSCGTERTRLKSYSCTLIFSVPVRTWYVSRSILLTDMRDWKSIIQLGPITLNTLNLIFCHKKLQTAAKLDKQLLHHYEEIPKIVLLFWKESEVCIDVTSSDLLQLLRSRKKLHIRIWA